MQWGCSGGHGVFALSGGRRRAGKPRSDEQSRQGEPANLVSVPGRDPSTVMMIDDGVDVQGHWVGALGRLWGSVGDGGLPTAPLTVQAIWLCSSPVPGGPRLLPWQTWAEVGPGLWLVTLGHADCIVLKGSSSP